MDHCNADRLVCRQIQQDRTLCPERHKLRSTGKDRPPSFCSGVAGYPLVDPTLRRTARGGGPRPAWLLGEPIHRELVASLAFLRRIGGHLCPRGMESRCERILTA